MNEKLKKYFERQLNYVELYPESGEMFLHNAFGAAEWEALRTENLVEAESIYNEWAEIWKPRFEKKIWESKNPS